MTTTTTTTGAAATAAPAPPPRRRRSHRPRVNWWLTALLAVCALTVLVPLYFTVVTALKTPDQLGGTGFGLPDEVRWQNFADAWRLTDYPRAALNSALITVGAVGLTLLTNSLVSYAIARNMHRRRFRVLYYYFVSALFVPSRSSCCRSSSRRRCSAWTTRRA
jgi:raffinose/stachyose/melibiose transport system permease protein